MGFNAASRPLAEDLRLRPMEVARWDKVDTASLVDAIRSHRAVELVYKGDSSGDPRIVHPHALYRTTTGGLCLEAIQVAGQSASGELPHWRQFHLMQIINARVLDVGFEPAPDFDLRSDKYRPGVLAAV